MLALKFKTIIKQIYYFENWHDNDEVNNEIENQFTNQTNPIPLQIKKHPTRI